MSRVAVVTGGTRGISGTVCERPKADGLRVEVITSALDVDRASTRQASQAALGAHVAELIRRLNEILSDPKPEAIHAARGAIRRLAAARKLFDIGLGPSDRRWLDRELNWLAHRLGKTRDLDVFLGRTAKRERGRVLSACRKARRKAARGAQEAAGSARARALIEGLSVWLAAGLDVGSSTAFRVQTTRTLRRLDLKLRRQGAEILHLSPAARHRLRRRVKTLRYGAELAAEAIPGFTVSARVSILADLHRILGDLNDLEVRRRLERRFPLEPEAPLTTPARTSSKELEADLIEAWARFLSHPAICPSRETHRVAQRPRRGHVRLVETIPMAPPTGAAPAAVY